MTTTRLDLALVARGLASSRARAQALIAAGAVRVDGRAETRAHCPVGAGSEIALSAPDHPWVSRGGLKLDAALKHFGLDPGARVALDLGASTGGFTEVLLARGAARVYAVDVGHGQLAPHLRADPRVIVRERVNARALSQLEVPETVAALVADVSFIGLETLLPAPLRLAAPGAWLVALVKPQFEAGPGAVDRRGIVRDPAIHAAVCQRIAAFLDSRPGWLVAGLMPSPILGGDGNAEFLIAARYAP